MSQIERTAILGAGVIGASWAAIFLASGRSVTVFDLDPNAEASVRAYIEKAWPALDELGLTARATPDAIRFAPTASEAVRGAQFIQENVPERLLIKHATYAEIEPELEDVSSSDNAVCGSNASMEPVTVARNLFEKLFIIYPLI